MQSHDYVVVDIESTGLYHSDRIVEIAAILLDGETLEEIDRYESLVNPLYHDNAIPIHRITSDMTSIAPTLEEIQVDLFNILDGNVIVGYHIFFDVAKIKKEIGELGGKMDFGNPVNIKTNANNLILACREYGIKPENGDWHRAIVDAECTVQLFTEVGTGNQTETPCEIILPHSSTIPQQKEPVTREMCF